MERELRTSGRCVRGGHPNIGDNKFLQNFMNPIAIGIDFFTKKKNRKDPSSPVFRFAESTPSRGGWQPGGME
jgi:hypothetical protein